MIMHEDSVESIVFSQNEKLLFSASLDKKVGIWSMESYKLLATLKADFPIRTIYLTDENDYLIAINKDPKVKTKRVCYWPLEKNEDSFRINVSLKGISNCYVTPNNEYLVTMTGNSAMAIWNIHSRNLV